MTSLDLQFFRFSVLLLTGATIGLFFDLYRAYRAVFRPGPFPGLLGDFLFSLIATVLGLVAFIFGAGGELRFYVLLALALGLGLYLWLASPLVLYAGRLFFTGLRKLELFLFKAVSLVFFRPLFFLLRLGLLPLVFLSLLGGNAFRALTRRRNLTPPSA